MEARLANSAMNEARAVNPNILYEPEETCPPLPAIATAAQMAAPNVVMVVVMSTAVIRFSGYPGGYLLWAVFMTLVSCGLTTMLQVFRLGRIGSGHLILTGFNIPFIAISTLALAKGGPALLASLTVVSTLAQILLTWRLALLRRVFTPVVSGTIVMLVASTAAPFLSRSVISDTPEDLLREAFVVFGVTLTVGVLVVLRAPQAWRLWIVGIMILAGLAASLPFGLYDNSAVAAAAWVGFPPPVWEGFDLSFSVDFFSLLPTFIFVGLVTFVKAVGDTAVIQRASRREYRAQDFRVVQGGLNAYGIGNLFAGALGIPSATTPWALTATYVTLTGVAARGVGIYLGLFTIGAALLPKLVAFLMAIPDAVLMAVYVIVFGLLFVEGARVALSTKLDHRKTLIIAVSLMSGLMAETIAAFFGGIVRDLLGSGVTVGGLMALGLTFVQELTGSRQRKIEAPLRAESLPTIDEFIVAFGERHKWTTAGTERLRAIGEELLLSLVQEDDEDAAASERRLVISLRMEGDSAHFEFLAAAGEGNIEDQIAYLGESPDPEAEQDASIRLLRHYASSVHHTKFQGIDVINVSAAREKASA